MKIPTPWALALLAAVAPLGAAQASTPQLLIHTSDAVTGKLKRSLLLMNTSGKAWTLGLYAPETGAPVGTLLADTFKQSDGTLASKGEISATRSIPLNPGECVAIAPPGRSISTMIGLTRRSGFSRSFYLKDEGGKKVDFTLTIPAEGDPNGDKPVVMFKELADYTALNGRAVSLDPAGGYWLNILMPRLP